MVKSTEHCCCLSSNIQCLFARPEAAYWTKLLMSGQMLVLLRSLDHLVLSVVGECGDNLTLSVT